MKRNEELLRNSAKTGAEDIRDETATAANTAERVGTHLRDMVKRLNNSGTRMADATLPSRPFVPTFSFKFDGYNATWLTSPDAFADSYGSAVPIMYFVTSELIHRGAMLAGATLTFVEGAGVTGYIQNDLGNFDTDVFKAGMIISMQGTNSNDHVDANSPRYFLISSVSGNKIYIDCNGTNRIGVTGEVGTTGVTIHRGVYAGASSITYTSLATLINTKSVDIGSYTRTARPFSTARNHLPMSDTEGWEEVYGSRRDLEAGVRAAAAMLGTPGRAATYEVTAFVHPTGINNERSRKLVRQAGYERADGYPPGNETIVGRMINNSATNPFNLQETNTAPPVRAANAKTSTVSGAAAQDVLTVTGGTGTFEGLIVGDPIVLYESEYSSAGWQFRTVKTAPTANDGHTTLVLSSNLDIAMTDAAWFDPRVEDFDITYGAAEIDQSTIGWINEVLRAGKGWLNIASHGGFTSKSVLERAWSGVLLLYLKYIKSLSGTALPIFKGMLGLSDDYGIKMRLWDAATYFAYGDKAIYDHKVWTCTSSGTNKEPGVTGWTDVSSLYPLMLTEPVHIAIKSFYDAHNDYAPLLEAGEGFSASEDGARMWGRLIQPVPAITDPAAALDGYLGKNEMSFYLTEDGTPKLMVRVRGGAGTLYTGEISLAADE